MEATQQLLGFLLKMTILWSFGGTTILGNTHIAAGFKLQVTVRFMNAGERVF